MAFCWLASLLAPSPSNVLLINHRFTQKWPVLTMFTLPVDIVFKKQIKHERHVSTNPPKSKHILLCTNITLHPLRRLYLPQRLNRNWREPLGGQQNWSHVAPFYPFSQREGDFEKAIKPVWRAGIQTDDGNGPEGMWQVHGRAAQSESPSAAAAVH